MHPPVFDDILEKICLEDPRYAPAAYQFLREGLDHTSRLLEKPRAGPARHITGPELLEGLRVYALSQFGPMTRTVLARWGVHTTTDFGEIVFNLVREGALGATEKDSIADFLDVYDFDRAFCDPFLPASQKQAEHLPSQEA